METPKALIDTYNHWRKAGRPLQVDSRWNINSWLRQLPDYEPLLNDLPQNKIGRDHGIRLTQIVKDENAAVRVFLLAMIWGYGPVGYGPYRVRRVLDSPSASLRLFEVAQLAQSRGGLEAFAHIAEERLKDPNYLKHLGPAFGTKYLYFLTASVSTVVTTPVMDAIVARWFVKNVSDASISVENWKTQSYASYISHLTEWSQSLVDREEEPLDLADVEYLIFAAGATFEKSPEWSEEWHNENWEPSTSELLDRLRATCQLNQAHTTEHLNLSINSRGCSDRRRNSANSDLKRHLASIVPKRAVGRPEQLLRQSTTAHDGLSEMVTSASHVVPGQKFDEL